MQKIITKIIISIFIISMLNIPAMGTSEPELTLSAVEKDDSRGYAVDYTLNDPYDIFDVEALEGFIWFTEFNVSKIWKFNPVNEELTAINLRDDITPLFIKKANDNTLWFLDYDYSPQNETDYVGRYDPSDGNLTLIPLPFKAHAINFEVIDNFAMVSVLNLDLIIKINTNTLETEELMLDCDGFCGPAGLDFDSEGNLWIAETLGNYLIKYDNSTHEQTFFDLPSRIRSPAFIRITDDNILWTGTHGGDRLARIDLSDMKVTQFVTPQPSKTQYPISGINDIEFAENGDIWFAEHFVNRIGRLHTESGTIHEYLSPRPNPLTAMILLDNNKLWYPETTGILGYLDLINIPTVSIAYISNQSTSGRELKLSLDVEYLSGIDNEIEFSIFGEVRNNAQFTIKGDTKGHALEKNQRDIYDIKISLDGNLVAGSYYFVVGINATTFTASQQFYLIIEKDLIKESESISSWQIMILFGLILIIIYVYRKDILKLIEKIRNKNNET